MSIETNLTTAHLRQLGTEFNTFVYTLQRACQEPAEPPMRPIVESAINHASQISALLALLTKDVDALRQSGVITDLQ